MPRYHYGNARDTVESTKKFSIFWLKANKYLEKDCFKFGGIKWSINGESTGNISFRIDTSENAYMQLDYRTKKHWETEWREKSYRVWLTKTFCFFGGFRYWFQCINCSKRAGVLYSADDCFVCRRCANLSYESCNENKRFKGWPYGILTRESRAERMYEKIKREYYNGKPTRKYKQYLKLRCPRKEDLLGAEVGMWQNLAK